MLRQNQSFLDRLLTEVDTALRVTASPVRAARPAPKPQQPTKDLSQAEKKLSASLMRVNHTGEIAAQALYRGQALLARDEDLRQALLEAAAEEQDHLAWCESRISQLGDRTSYLAPLWYAGSFLIGACAAAGNDKVSLGFLAETERQVTRHLESHLSRLPEGDSESRTIVEKMRAEEIAHSTAAMNRGAAELPAPVIGAMRLASKLMTSVSFRL
jgi:ubiquinone biosynthesis monooxygenase Coq7